VNQRIVRGDRSVLRIDQRIQISRCEVGTDVSGPACIYACVEVRKGTVVYLQGESEVPAPRRLAIFLPPFAVVQARLEKCNVRTIGIAVRPPAQSGFPLQALLLPPTADDPPASLVEIFRRLHSMEVALGISRAPDPLPLALRTKTILDAEYATSIAIGRIAGRAHVSPETLSRRFKRVYGMSPVRYRHQVRVMDALMRLAEGELPANVFQAVGFDDLSRFYKIFRKVACATPGKYRLPRSRNAKT
jgi:AraC-like DNA-binding protein